MDESALYSRLGQLVRQHRERLGANQADIGKAVGLSRASIANIETGRQRIPLHHLYTLARALKVDAYTLLPILTDDAFAFIHREIRSTSSLSEGEQEEVERVVQSIGVSKTDRRKQ
jgi:transcriptional regulator with XRE-family HTH domain